MRNHSDVIRFSLPGLRAGFRTCLPVALGVAVYGVLFGLLARQRGLSLVETQSMSLFVFAGASQLIALDLWSVDLSGDLPVVSLIITTLIVNLRHVLMGAALSPWLTRLTSVQAFGSLFFMTDESWALTLGRMIEDKRCEREPDGAFLLGAGLCVYVFWNLSTALGHILVRGLFGDVIDPAKYGLDFAFTAVFTALLVGLKPRRQDILPLIAATATALACARLLPGKWYILAGAIAGGLAAALGPAPRPAPGPPSDNIPGPPARQP